MQNGLAVNLIPHGGEPITISRAARRRWSSPPRDDKLPAMVVFALISLAVSPAAVTGQSAPVAYTAQVYQAPVVRPFEPPSNFGRVTEEGDGGGDTRLRVITAPVSVEAYRRSYEHAPSRADNAYDAGVNNAERSMDARMGPLDGRWLLKDGEGRTLMTVSLMDQGETRPLEGGYRTADATAEVGPLTAAERSAGVLVLEMGGGRLSLQSSGEGWSGVLARGDREWPVTLVR